MLRIMTKEESVPLIRSEHAIAEGSLSVCCVGGWLVRVPAVTAHASNEGSTLDARALGASMLHDIEPCDNDNVTGECPEIQINEQTFSWKKLSIYDDIEIMM